MSEESLLAVPGVCEPTVLRVVPAQPEVLPPAPVAAPNVVRLVPAQPVSDVSEDADELARLRAEVLYLRSELLLLKAQLA